MGSFRKELTALLNTWNMEMGSNTPDDILAQYIDGCLAAFDDAVLRRDQWYGEEHAVVSVVSAGADAREQHPIASE
jgi:hypothetical protein